MDIEKSIIEFKKMIERDEDTLRYWKSDTFGHYDEPIKKLEKDVLISETLLTAYEKEKEKNKKLNKYIEDRVKIGKNIQTFINKDYVEQEYISKDKIKAKIEELEKDLKEYENGQEWEIQDEIRGQIEVLQSLLEKE